MPWDDYTLNLQRHSAELSPNVVIYQDLTMGAAATQTSVTSSHHESVSYARGRLLNMDAVFSLHSPSLHLVLY